MHAIDHNIADYCGISITILRILVKLNTASRLILTLITHYAHTMQCIMHQMHHILTDIATNTFYLIRKKEGGHGMDTDTGCGLQARLLIGAAH